jgi:hypothetical protein
MANLRIAELDFDTIKTNLTTFLQSQSEFTDYDFTGSGLAVLIDLLAYNTHYNAYLANMVVNEMFLDSAVKRASAVSIAKHLGYTPTSARGAIANLSVTVTSPPGLPSSITMDRYTPFTTSIGGTPYTFLTTEAKIAPRVGSTYTFSSVDVVEGAVKQYSFVVSAVGPDQKYEIANNAIDTTTLSVTVQNSATDTTTNTYTLATDITGLTSTSNVFFLEENTQGNYYIYFGDDILGRQLTTGNIINIRYVATNGTAGNISSKIAQSFAASGTIGDTSNIVVVVNSKSTGGANKETITSIKYNAPKVNAASNRLVTAADYEAIIAAQFTAAESVSVWGGEDNDPPIYGKVVISLKPYNGYTISENTKIDIINNILKQKKVLAIQPVFVDPTYYYVGITASVSYNPILTTLSSSGIQTLVNQAITSYFSSDLQKFNKTYNRSTLINNIKIANKSIESVNIVEKLQRRIQLVLNTDNIFTSKTAIKFRNSIQPGQLSSSYFYVLYNNASTLVKIVDIPDDSPPNLNGYGTLRLVNTATGSTVSTSIGTVDYANGIVSITKITPVGFPTDVGELAITCGLQNIGNNLNLSRNEIFVQDDYTLNAVGGRQAGTTFNISTV